MQWVAWLWDSSCSRKYDLFRGQALAARLNFVWDEEQARHCMHTFSPSHKWQPGLLYTMRYNSLPPDKPELTALTLHAWQHSIVELCKPYFLLEDF